ncbi:MAG: hypothetical protein L3K26_13410 [Candidatus Hydrogenedentes bacterium]|nr:hypothetical protein [Candidatus Hydrogenedentota bacterium]
MTTTALDILLDAALSAAVREIYAQGSAAVVFALTAMVMLLVEQQTTSEATSHQTPSTPSGMKPVYQKPSP